MTMNNERGNTTLFTIGAMFILMLMFIFVINLAKVFAVKEHAHTSAQQASLAATAVLYEDIWNAVDNYEKTIIGTVGSYPKSIRERVNDRSVYLQNIHPDWSYNEAYVEAIDEVLAEEMKHGAGKKKLKEAIQDELNPNIIFAMKAIARDAITANDGTLTGAEIKFFDDYRIYVRAANTMESIDFGSFFNSFKDDVYQVGAGPEIGFLKELDSWANRTESLE